MLQTAEKVEHQKRRWLGMNSDRVARSPIGTNMSISLRPRILALAGLLAAVALVTTGCVHHERHVSRPPTEPTSLAMRLDAARGIAFMNQRDEALGSVARDAAQAGDVAITKEALQGMTFMLRRDAAAEDCALKLSEAGHGPAAVEVAKLITFMNKRDAVLKKLAMGE